MKIIEKMEIQYVIPEGEEEAAQLRDLVSEFENAPPVTSLAGFTRIHKDERMENGVWQSLP